MGSVAQDKNGNMALGYSVSSETVYPSIRFTGRKRNDPPGQMTIPETSIMEGTGSQLSSFNRWGDYTSSECVFACNGNETRKGHDTADQKPSYKPFFSFNGVFLPQ
jgi:hypothetical protein